MNWLHDHVKQSPFLGPLPNSKNRNRVKLSRRISTVITYIGAAALCGLSLPYAAAFAKVDGPVGVVWLQNSFEQAKGNGGTKWVLGEYKVNSAYMLPGQAMRADYNLSAGTRMRLVLQTCASMPIVELFKCNVVSEQKFETTVPSGQVYFPIQKGGVHRVYSEVITVSDKSSNDSVTWSTARK